ncbi:MAG: cupin domain-containing protein [Thermoanaerobaculia bacterium]|nr:cupin domain-containing protein [Thermoanaerobaculia bacterium]
MKRFLTGVLVAACVCFAGSIAAAEAAKEPAKKVAKAAKPAWTLWAAPDVKFTDVEGMKGAQVAPLWGDMKKGPWGSLFKWAPGFLSPWHSHSHSVRVVVAQGTFTIEPEGQPLKEFGSGSYLRDPGKTSHRSGCKAGGPDCVFFVEQNGPWDVIVAEEKK